MEELGYVEDHFDWVWFSDFCGSMEHVEEGQSEHTGMKSAKGGQHCQVTISVFKATMHIY